MRSKGPGKHYREGMTLVDLMDMFPTEDAATTWFEDVCWNGQRCCGKCGSTKTRKASHKTMPYWCTDCRSYFSVRTGTPIARSNVPLRKWAIAIYLCLTSLKSVSSLKLHRDIGVSQKTAWFMLHRIREAWAGEGEDFDGPVEVDESYFGGKRRNMSNAQREALYACDVGPGTFGKTAVAGLKDRATNRVSAAVVRDTTGPTLRGFVRERTKPGALVYSDEARAYRGLPFHQAIKHSEAQYVDGDAHTNGVESFWSMLKRAYKGTFHKISPKHLDRYVQEFAGKHNLRELDTLAQMRLTVARLIGRNLRYHDLIADNGLWNAARSA